MNMRRMTRIRRTGDENETNLEKRKQSKGLNEKSKKETDKRDST